MKNIKIPSLVYSWMNESDLLAMHRRAYLKSKTDGKTTRLPRRLKLELMGRI